MSTYFWPSKGTHVEYRYYDSYEYEGTIEVVEDHQPSFNSSCFIVHSLFAALGYADRDPNGGTFINAELPTLRERVEALPCGESSLRERYYSAFMQVINCAIHHGADINYG